MLLELSVHEFAVIEELRLSLKPGLTVLTGETGAGKSLLVDALGALLGGRLTQQAIRTGSAGAWVEGIFECPANGDELQTLMEEHGVWDDSRKIILSRELNTGGRSVARINRQAVPVTLLREVGVHLVDMHGQSEQLSLLDNRQHVMFLDKFGGLIQQQQEFGSQVAELRKRQQELEGMRQDDAELHRHLALLSFQVGEIEAAGLLSGEEATLIAEREKLANAWMLTQGALNAYNAVTQGVDLSALDLVEQAKRSLKEAAGVDPTLQSHLESLEDIAINLTDIAGVLRSYIDNIEADPVRQTEVEERLDLIARLRHKYGHTLEDVLSFAKLGEEEIQQAEGDVERWDLLTASVAALEMDMGIQAEFLSQARKEVLHLLEEAIHCELAELGMDQVQFSIQQGRRIDSNGLPLVDGQRFVFSRTGVDQIEFLISTNTGEELKPLSLVASGGETSRLMLAIKSALQNADSIPTLVFDEIEIGIGGRGGDVIGKKLWALAGGRQVLCITHLPQVACYGDAHIRVTKGVREGRSFTWMDSIDEVLRLDEIAAMLGGTSDQLRTSGQELLDRARAWKDRHNNID